ncbi:TRAP transporter large permease [Paracoccus pantotrophus]|uniref:TRAP transporter large permease protein n=1 Tax=Paracoccus pantotrophus TaxID=82367 RepID=A0A7H9BQB3_PARPN|nr:TRAP transporter large permease [Paracoccus pantotrophus]QLH12995.1 TRAP transporter large permease [Paracoccus pantotrophus]
MAPLFIVLAILAFLAASIAVGAVLGLLSFGVDWMYTSGRLSRAIGNIYWEKSIDFLLMAAPLFIMLGEIILRAGIAHKMYTAVSRWLTWLPGGLMHANIGTSALFAATSGSSVATTATIGVAAYPEIKRHKYNESLFMGSIAAGGTLGILIPPSVLLILYGILTETSIPELYLAGIIPGLVLCALFMVVVFVICLIKPEWGGTRLQTSWKERWQCLPDLLAPLVLFIAVVGSIYAGIATPTEAAAVGVCMALLLAAINRTLSWGMIVEASIGTMKTTAMIMFIVLSAMFLNFLFTYMGVTRAMLGFISELGMTPVQTILIIVAFYLLLGMFMETTAMVLTTVPLVFPIIAHLGVPEYTGVWFGIVLTLLMEAGLITPPIGMNLFVAHGIREPGSKFSDVAVGAIPFLIPMLLMVFVLIAWPPLATWLPDMFYR